MDWTTLWSKFCTNLPKFKILCKTWGTQELKQPCPLVDLQVTSYIRLHVSEILPLWAWVISTWYSVSPWVLLCEDLSLHRAWNNRLKDIYSPAEIKYWNFVREVWNKCHFTEWVHLKEHINQKIVLYMHLNAPWLLQSVTDHHISLWKKKLQTDCRDLGTLGQQGLE